MQRGLFWDIGGNIDVTSDAVETHIRSIRRDDGPARRAQNSRRGVGRFEFHGKSRHGIEQNWKINKLQSLLSKATTQPITSPYSPFISFMTILIYHSFPLNLYGGGNKIGKLPFQQQKE
jgi:hypothetical protein